MYVESRDRSRRWSNAGNDSLNDKANFTNIEGVMSRSISHIRAGFLRMSEILSSSLGVRIGWDAVWAWGYQMATGRTGQNVGAFRTGLLYVKTIRNSRCRGYANTTDLHLRHTCASLCHFHGLSSVAACRWQLNISRSTSSGSV